MGASSEATSACDLRPLIPSFRSVSNDAFLLHQPPAIADRTCYHNLIY